MQIQESIFDTIDTDFTKWEKQKNELIQLRDKENFNELFFRRKEIQKTKREMKMYIKNFSNEDMDDIYDEVKATICERSRQMLNDLAAVLDFSAEEGNMSKFDDLLDTHTINEINV